MNFTERTELETGFSDIFDRDVGAALTKIEKDRIEKLGKARLYAPGAAIVGIGMAVLLFSTTNGGFWFFLAALFGMGGAFGGLGIWSSYSTAWAGAVEEAVMPAICKHVGDVSFDSQGGTGFPVMTFRDLGIVGTYNRSSIKNQLTGTHHSTDFEIVEACLQQKTRKTGKNGSSSTKTVFQGLLFRISVPTEAPGRILIARDFGKIGNTFSAMFSFGKGRGMPRVEMPHQAFEAAFEVHADNPTAALEFMPVPFLDSLLDIARAEGARGTKSMMAGFTGTSFYMALSQSQGFMKMGGLTKSVSDMEEDLHGIFADIELAHRVIDRLHGA